MDKKFPIDEKRIQYAMYAELMKRGHQVVVPNVSWSWLNWEADLISFTKTGYMWEFEVKVTAQDFKNDFVKRKHRVLKNPHYLRHRCPNYFCYVAPIKAVPLCIPDHAGLVLVCNNGEGFGVEYVKNPKKLHGEKTPDKGVRAILRSVMFKYWDLAKILDQNKIQLSLFRND